MNIHQDCCIDISTAICKFGVYLVSSTCCTSRANTCDSIMSSQTITNYKHIKNLLANFYIQVLHNTGQGITNLMIVYSCT